MKKQLLLSTLAVVAIAGYLHADENRPQGSTRDVKREKVTEVTRSMAKVVVAADKADSEENSDVKGKEDQDKEKNTNKKEKEDNTKEKKDNK